MFGGANKVGVNCRGEVGGGGERWRDLMTRYGQVSEDDVSIKIKWLRLGVFTWR